MPLSEEEIKDAMEQYGNLRFHIENMKSEKQTIIDKILQKYPHIQKEIEEAEEELGNQIEYAEKQEKKYKKTLQAMLNQFSKLAIIKDTLVLNTKLLKVTLTKKVKYDVKALDGMAVENPKLLAFRDEEISSRIDLNKL